MFNNPVNNVFLREFKTHTTSAIGSDFWTFDLRTSTSIKVNKIEVIYESNIDSYLVQNYS